MDPRATYFAYGSNLDADQLCTRCPSATIVGPASLAEHVIAFAGYSKGWNGAVATVVPRRGGRVDGLVYEMDAADLLKLDRFEGHPRVYERSPMEVVQPGGATMQTHVYVHTNPTQVSRPSSQYLDRIRLAYVRLGFDATPLAAAANVDHTADAEGETTCVFVYGSLLLGEENHDAIRPARWLGNVRTEPRYTLCDLGEFPALVGDGDASVAGELYAVGPETLAALDELEEHPHVYRRGEIQLIGGMSAQAYLLGEALARGASIADGDWRAHRRRLAARARAVR